MGPGGGAIRRGHGISLQGRQSVVGMSSQYQGCSVFLRTGEAEHPLALSASVSGSQDWWPFSKEQSWVVKPPAPLVTVPSAGEDRVLRCTEASARPAGL